MKRKLLFTISLFIILSVLTGFHPASANTLQQSFQANLVPVSKMELPAKTIIGFGEATHGNKQFTTLKLDIFKHLVEKQGYRVFAIEGDFGGGQKVNEYILGGSGTAQDAAKAIGFTIYHTEEMAALLSWMRAFNEKRDAKDQIHFYGFDMQRYDHNKNGLFSYLKKVDPTLASKYEKLLTNLNDKTVYNQKVALVQEAIPHIKSLMDQMKQNQSVYIAKSSEKAYELATAFAESIKQNATLRGTNVNYSNTRDRYMADKVMWILSFEKKQYGRKNMFIAGHNGHIEKTSTSVGMTTCMGAHLAKALGDQYYAIGSEFYESTFLANDASTNERKAFTVKNSGKDRLAVLFAQTGMADGFLDFAKAKHHQNFYTYLNKAQSISAIGDVFSGWYGKMEKLYTLQMVPAKAFDAIIFVRTATPSVMIKD
ncbi:erythromycin esterase family protein [Brevibacillus porteri]|uniref:Erythromycin esterase n=1 Tax=Brevibacillus porteri TaxID=2126350 RepID=A0ABX5FS37_9BACL|nr:erythromycin esterase family protein [Brevibacillus porteri]MED1799387.1 erythromycin esterase family protein [Brevibacillus porteri]MED2131861.1 erythromycin esterase family protein [Brevibacillus porteri]MED2742816.1 erythromycin esterase family protein [Brevibacillus porteri]MED2817848.1 erythromycin esterase family protein [Brevibacillus porteri]MED2893150.1 erythromycin esterase family protein [Brevibacillus porteri]